MSEKRNRRLRLFTALVCACAFVHPVQASGNPEVESARRFVQGFYGWYVPKALKDGAGPAWGLAVKSRSSAFSVRLLHALREDLTAQAKVQGEIVGLDFDPFLNSQDPGSHYSVGTIDRKGAGYLVSVHSGSHKDAINQAGCGGPAREEEGALALQ